MSSINADNGVVSGITGIRTTADGTGNLALQSNGVTVLTLATNNTATFANNVSISGALTTTGAVTQTGNASFSANVAVTGSLTSINTFGFKNRFINGNMVIDQRNAGASVTPTNSQYLVDRFYAALSQASKFTAQQTPSATETGYATRVAAGYTNYLGLTSSSAYSVAAGDFFAVGQVIEGLNISDLAWGTASAKTITLSALVYSSLTGTFGGALQNSAGDYCYPFTYTISSANTWTQVSITIAGPTLGTWLTTNGAGIKVFFNLGTGTTYSGTAGSWAASTYISATGATSVVGTSGAKLYITGVQLEVGSQATSFDFRSIGTELLLCQRYYETTAYPNVTQSLNTVVTTVVTTSGNTCGAHLMVAKRTTPTITLYSRNGTSGSVSYSATGADTAGSAAYIGGTSWAITSVPAGPANGAGIEFGWTATAEL